MASHTGNTGMSVDAKGRVFLPRPLQDKFMVRVGSAAPDLVVFRGAKGCLNLWLKEDFEAMVLRLEDSNLADAQYHELLRGIYDNKLERAWDSQKRILLSLPLMEYADLTDQVLFLEVGKAVEIWNPEKGEAARAVSTKKMEDHGTLTPPRGTGRLSNLASASVKVNPGASEGS
ncbi:MAG: hypothetical protein OTJ44_08490 [Planctomycetota bacterium]|nr:hypothetical protein [Planctomycetota bacterium]